MDKSNLLEEVIVYMDKKYKRVADYKGIISWYSPEDLLVPINLYDILENEYQKTKDFMKNINLNICSNPKNI